MRNTYFNAKPKEQTESHIESWVKEKIEPNGFLFWKFVSPGTTGVPDRVIVSPTGKVYFVEFKTEIGKQTAIQRFREGQLKTRGANFRLVVGMTDAIQLVKELQEG